MRGGKDKSVIVDCHPNATALTNDFLGHYVTQLGASPAQRGQRPLCTRQDMGGREIGLKVAGLLLWGATLGSWDDRAGSSIPQQISLNL